MDGFKNTTRMKTFGDEAPRAYAKGGSVKPMVKAAAKAPAKAPMKKANGGDVSKMRPDQRLASMEKSSRAMTPAETRSLQAIKTAKAAAPKQGPLIKPARQMTPADRRMNQMDRPTNNMGAEAYKGGGKVGGSKVPFAVKKVMRKAEGGAVSQPASMPSLDVMKSYNVKQPTPMPEISDTGSGYVPQPGGAQPAGPSLQSLLGGLDPSLVKHLLSQETATQPAMPASAGRMADMYNTSPGPMPTMPNEPMPSAPMGAAPEARPAYESMPEYIAMQKQMADLRSQDAAGRAQLAAQNAARAQAQQMQEQRDAAQIRREAAPRFMR